MVHIPATLATARLTQDTAPTKIPDGTNGKAFQIYIDGAVNKAFT
jgi:hypothetical protein